MSCTYTHYWRGLHSKCSRVIETVEHLSDPMIDSCSGVQRVCCWAPCRQQISISSRRQHSAANAGSVTLTAKGWGWTDYTIYITQYQHTVVQAASLQKKLPCKSIIYHFVSAAVAVDSSHMTASSCKSMKRDDICCTQWKRFKYLDFRILSIYTLYTLDKH